MKMGSKSMILLKMIEILLKSLTVRGRFEKIRKVFDLLIYPSVDLFTVIVDHRKEKKRTVFSPFEVGFLTLNQNSCLLPPDPSPFFFQNGFS
jgi:hypothetical protein